MRTWRFVKSLATFNVFREGLVASELLENSVDPPLKFLRSFDQGFVDKLLTFSVVAPFGEGESWELMSARHLCLVDPLRGSRV